MECMVPVVITALVITLTFTILSMISGYRNYKRKDKDEE